MKVALVALHFAEYSSRLALALSPHHEVLLCLNSSNAQYELSTALRREVSTRLDVRWFGDQRRRSQPFQAVKLATAVWGYRPNIVHVQEEFSWVPTWANELVGRSFPLVLTVHDPLPHSGGAYRATRLREHADRIIVHGKILQDEWSGRVPQISARLASVPHGVLGGYQISERVLPEGPPVFLFFGRIERYKGLGLLLQAAGSLISRGFQFRLIVAGTGADLDRYRSQIRKSPWVELIDRRSHADELPHLFKRTSAVVLPYTDATQSGVAAMAFGFGLPVIASSVGGLPETVENEHNGLLVPPGDVNSLAKAMSRLIESESLREQLASGARDSASKKLSWDLVARKTLLVYEGAVRAHGQCSFFSPGHLTNAR